MDYKEILFTLEDGLAVITLNRASRKNALTSLMRSEITHAVRMASAEARAVVLTGAGDAFCSGQDLSDASSSGDLDLERTLRDEYLPMVEAIYNCPVPVVAAVNGAAAGAGASLALASDVVIASESAFFMQAFSKIGLMPDAAWHLVPAAPDRYGQGDGCGVVCRPYQRAAGQRLGHDLGSGAGCGVRRPLA